MRKGIMKKENSIIINNIKAKNISNYISNFLRSIFKNRSLDTQIFKDNYSNTLNNKIIKKKDSKRMINEPNRLTRDYNHNNSNYLNFSFKLNNIKSITKIMKYQ